MVIEEKLPERFLTSAFHPSLFIYAWKRTDLDKLFEEIMASNIAISGGEAWLVEGDKGTLLSGEIKTFGVIPLRDGDKEILNWKVSRKKGEDWYDFVERSTKETLEKISGAGLEKKTSAATRKKIWYHFDFLTEEDN